MIARLLPELGFEPHPVTDPFPERTQAREAELRGIWAGCELRNDRIRAVADVRCRPFEESLRDCVESLLAIGKGRPRRATV